jgi:hypothetical protein
LVLFKLINQGLFPLVKILTNFWVSRKKFFPSGKNHVGLFMPFVINLAGFPAFQGKISRTGKKEKKPRPDSPERGA